MAVHGFLYNQPQMLRVDKLKMAKSTAQAKTVPRFKKLMLKLMA